MVSFLAQYRHIVFKAINYDFDMKCIILVEEHHAVDTCSIQDGRNQIEHGQQQNSLRLEAISIHVLCCFLRTQLISFDHNLSKLPFLCIACEQRERGQIQVLIIQTLSLMPQTEAVESSADVTQCYTVSWVSE